MKIIPEDLWEAYQHAVPKGLVEACSNLEDAELSSANFSFYTSVASVFSSKIEGEDIDLDSYVKHKKFGLPFLPDYTRKTDDLYDAYIFARNNALNSENLAVAHALLAKHLLSEHELGKFRTQNMYVSTPDGRIEYVAASPYEVSSEMQKLFYDMETLAEREMNLEQVFFYAALLHLVFVKIHPWTDGNGRSARLLEKWFLASKLGEKAWFIQSEKYYYQHHNAYYNNLRALGMEYPLLDYSMALPFLLMLPSAVTETLGY